MVAGVGLEPTQRERRGILNPLCLPISPPGLGKVGGAFRSRTGLDGFAIRYITALLTRLYSVCLFRPKPVIHPLRFVLLIGDVEIAYLNHLILK